MDRSETLCGVTFKYDVFEKLLDNLEKKYAPLESDKVIKKRTPSVLQYVYKLDKREHIEVSIRHLPYTKELKIYHDAEISVYHNGCRVGREMLAENDWSKIKTMFDDAVILWKSTAEREEVVIQERQQARDAVVKEFAKLGITGVKDLDDYRHLPKITGFNGKIGKLRIAVGHYGGGYDGEESTYELRLYIPASQYKDILEKVCKVAKKK